MTSIEELQERLEAAELVCVLFGWASLYRPRGERDEAFVQAWLDWSEKYDCDNFFAPSDPEWDQRIKDLARRREFRLVKIGGEES